MSAACPRHLQEEGRAPRPLALSTPGPENMVTTQNRLVVPRRAQGSAEGDWVLAAEPAGERNGVFWENHSGLSFDPSPSFCCPLLNWTLAFPKTYTRGCAHSRDQRSQLSRIFQKNEEGMIVLFYILKWGVSYQKVYMF